MKTLLYNWKIYLDTCCLSRPFNDQTQTRIRRETAAIQTLLKYCFAERWLWITSDVFLTTDDRLIRRANRIRARLQVRVENPYIWLQEIRNERTKDD